MDPLQSKITKKIEFESEDESDDSKVNISVEIIPESELNERDLMNLSNESGIQINDQEMVLKKKHDLVVRSLKNSIKELTKERDAAESSVKKKFKYHIFFLIYSL